MNEMQQVFDDRIGTLQDEVRHLAEERTHLHSPLSMHPLERDLRRHIEQMQQSIEDRISRLESQRSTEESLNSAEEERGRMLADGMNAWQSEVRRLSHEGTQPFDSCIRSLHAEIRRHAEGMQAMDDEIG